MTRGEVTFVFHKHSGEAIQTSCFMNFIDPTDWDEMQEEVITTVIDFTDGKEDQFKFVTVVVDIAELEHYLTAKIFFNEGEDEWENTMTPHKMPDTIH